MVADLRCRDGRNPPLTCARLRAVACSIVFAATLLFSSLRRGGIFSAAAIGWNAIGPVHFVRGISRNYHSLRVCRNLVTRLQGCLLQRGWPKSRLFSPSLRAFWKRHIS